MDSKQTIFVMACGMCLASVASADPITLPIQIRDFLPSGSAGGHPDFQAAISGVRTGMVASTLGPDGLPVYVGSPGYGSVASSASFNQWYRDVEGVNLPIAGEITLNQVGSVWRYESNAYFPIDGMGFGNGGQSHNYHFTMMMQAEFQYAAGANQRLTYAGDDDLWAFVNGQLVIDIGGIHEAASDDVFMDELGLQDGVRYPLHIFFAERRTFESNLRIETSFPIVPTPSGALVLMASLAFSVRRRR